MQALPVTDARAFLAHHLDAVSKLPAGDNPLPGLLGKKE